MCRDAERTDASLVHPAEVVQWDCIDDQGNFTELDGVRASCGCPASHVPTAGKPAPPTTPELVSPASLSMQQLADACGETESFRIVSEALPVVEDCYHPTSDSFAGGGSFEVWSPSGTSRYNQIVVAGIADDGSGEYVSRTSFVGAMGRLFLSRVSRGSDGSSRERYVGLL